MKNLLVTILLAFASVCCWAVTTSISATVVINSNNKADIVTATTEAEINLHAKCPGGEVSNVTFENVIYPGYIQVTAYGQCTK